MDYEQRKKELQAELDSRLAQQFLKSPLVKSDSHEDEEMDAGAMMTEDRAWYFVPCLDDPVMIPGTIARPEHPSTDGRVRWRIEVMRCYPGGRWNPDEYDLDEIPGTRADSLYQAIENAALAALSNEMRNWGEGEWHLMNHKLEEEFPPELH